LFAVGLHTCTAVARSLCVSWAFLLVLSTPVVVTSLADGLMNEVTLRRAGLVLRWVIVRGYTVFVFNQLNQATQSNSAWPSCCGYA